MKEKKMIKIISNFLKEVGIPHHYNVRLKGIYLNSDSSVGDGCLFLQIKKKIKLFGVRGGPIEGSFSEKSALKLIIRGIFEDNMDMEEYIRKITTKKEVTK